LGSELCFGITKTLSIHPLWADSWFFLMLTHSKNREEEIMEQKVNTNKKRGGRPKKEITKNRLLTVKCSQREREKIENRAKSVNLSLSQYMREIALTGRIDIRNIVFPKEVLQFTGSINHIAANLNQIAKKRNGIEELNAIERAELQIRSRELKQLSMDIKSYLK
jgi:hypothetical protein